MNKAAKIQLEKMNAYYGKRIILNNITTEFPSNQITAVLGQSGCGKSTLLKSINRILEEDGGRIEGTILLDGAAVDEMNLEQLRKKVGMLFQMPTVFPCSIAENILYVSQYHQPVKKKEQIQVVEHYLTMTGLYEEVHRQLDAPAEKLSGGQQQRLAIARCLSTNPEVIMLDEPCSALDMKNTILIEKRLVELKKKYTIIIVTHNIAQAKRIADRVVFMDDGKVIETAVTDEFFTMPSTSLAKEFIHYTQY